MAGEKAVDAAPQVLPVLAFVLGERRQGGGVAEGGEMGIGPQQLKLPRSRPQGVSVVGLERLRVMIADGLEPA